MKKIFALLIFSLLILSLIACAGESAGTADTAVTTDHATIEPTPTPESENATTIEEDNTPSGLIALNLYSGTTATHSVVCIDPDTGATRVISRFSYPNRNNQDVLYAVVGTSGTGSHREALSSNYDKLAAYQINTVTLAYHAGYFDTQSNFVDVTRALGLHAKTDFDMQAYHTPLGFTEDDRFVWYDRNAKKYYHIDIHNLSAENICEGNPFDSRYPKEVTDHFYNNTYKLDYNYRITDQLDANRYLANRFSSFNENMIGSVILNATDLTITEYVSGEARTNYAAVASPDGTRIAFMSELATGQGDAGIFITLPENGTPVEVKTEFRWATSTEYRRGYSHDKNYQAIDGYRLIDWE